jgi:hypothetical protein
MNRHYLAPDEATRTVDARLHGLRCKIGRARAKAKHAGTLKQKIEAKLEEKTLRQELTQAYRSYHDDISALVDEEIARERVAHVALLERT